MDVVFFGLQRVWIGVMVIVFVYQDGIDFCFRGCDYVGCGVVVGVDLGFWGEMVIRSGVWSLIQGLDIRCIEYMF